MRYFLGVDGGQSSTKAIIGDETGRVLGLGVGGPCNHSGAAEGTARLEIGAGGSVRAACESAGLDAQAIQFEAACFGMSGGPDDKEAILRRIIPARRLLVTTDATIALAGATPNGQGIIVIAGTGSIAFGRNAQGRSARAGGWGHVFGDEGGGFDIVRQALRACLRMEEGWGPSTRLRGSLLEATGARDANDALHLFYTDEWHRSRTARLAPLVDQAAGQSDRAADEILKRAAQDLAGLASAVRSQLWDSRETIDVAYVGGAFRSEILLQRFLLLMSLGEGARCAPPLHSPAEGALLEAYRSTGLEPHFRPIG